MKHRDDFNASVLKTLANRVGHCCSNPDCRRETSGPDSTKDGSINQGVGAHITAAAKGGKRYDSQLSASERSAFDNGIWLCPDCASLIDRDETLYTKAVLLTWKQSAEQRASSLLNVPARPQDSDEPILILPSTDPTKSWLSFSSRSTSFVGRKTEKAALDSFLNSGERFSWWMLTGEAGAGKSRLALETCRDVRPGWNAGFFGKAEQFSDWTRFRPSRPTFIVLDYVAGRAKDVSVIALQLARSARFFPHRVRLLLIERDQGSWWSRFLREESQSESAEILACQHGDALSLGCLESEELLCVAADSARSQHVLWTEPTARSFEQRMRTLDPLGRPLFAMMAAASSSGETASTVVDSVLLRSVLKKEAARRSALVPEHDPLRKMENLAILATLVGGVRSSAGDFAFLMNTEIASLLPNTEFLDVPLFREFVSATSADSVLAGLQPDILGERFVLDRLASGSSDSSHTRRLLAAAWLLQPEDLCDFIVRAASDFPGDPSQDLLSDLSLDSAAQRSRWGRLVGDLVRVARRSADARTRRLLEALRSTASEKSDEHELQVALAGAEFNLGNIFLFVEDNPSRAKAQFDAAILHGAGDPEIEASVINNRGILHHELDEEDKAFADFSQVITKAGVCDEARACSLNNRADIFARRRAHEEAIRDRSEVLDLVETSPDRRYIALVRRSRSYAEIGKTAEAMEDLKRIQSIDDIAPEQKAEALFQQGMLFKAWGRLDDARNYLEPLLATDEVFRGTHAVVLVELGELARLEPDPARAREYLEVACSMSDATDETLIEALIVRARLSIDMNDTLGAESIWQSILANPRATARQRSIAGDRDAANS